MNNLQNISGVNEWPIKRVAISELKPYERNPRTITPKAYARLKDKILRLGFNSPIQATHDLRVIGGHQRIKILQELGVEHVNVATAPYVMTEEQFKEALIESNISDGSWDMDILQLDYEPASLELYGFDMKLVKVGDKEGLTDPDAIPELPEEPISKEGDIWQLDTHRIMCGSSTNPDHVKALLGNDRPHLMVTDPPYGVEYDGNWQSELGVSADGTTQRLTSGKVIKPNKKTNLGNVHNDDNADWVEAWALFPGNIAYVWHADRFTAIVARSLEDCGFKLRNMIVWAKSQLVFGRGDYHHQHEPCWYAVKGTGNWTGDRKQSTLWQIDKPQKRVTGHSTQKPIECMKRPIENNSVVGDYVYEPFSGSGTTIIAGEMTGRHVLAMELSAAYVDLAVRRWVEFSGKVATRMSDGFIIGVTKV